LWIYTLSPPPDFILKYSVDGIRTWFTKPLQLKGDYVCVAIACSCILQRDGQQLGREWRNRRNFLGT